MKINFRVNLTKLIRNNFLFFVSFILILFYIAFGLIVRDCFVTSEVNKKIVTDLLIYAIAFYISTIAFFALRKIDKKNIKNIRYFLAPGCFFLCLLSIGYLFSLTRLIYNNIQNIVNELNYAKDFFFADFASYFGKNNISRTVDHFTNIIFFVSFFTLLLTTCFVKIAYRKQIFINFFGLKQKAINNQVINYNEIKGFLYKALP
jgi:hypothetical protein